jgi:hypothetical protein
MSVDMDAHALDCGGLSLEAEGLLSRVRRILWRRGTLPDDAAAVAHAVGIDPRTVRRLWPEIEHAFAVDDGLLRDPQVDRAKTFAEKSGPISGPISGRRLGPKPLKTPAAARCKEVRERIQSLARLDRARARRARRLRRPHHAPRFVQKFQKGNARRRRRRFDLDLVEI